MIVTPDCVDAEPVRERLRARGYREVSDDIEGFVGLAEVWIFQGTPPDIQVFNYCGSNRDKFLAQAVIEAGI
jgi:hypothetical protein